MDDSYNQNAYNPEEEEDVTYLKDVLEGAGNDEERYTCTEYDNNLSYNEAYDGGTSFYSPTEGNGHYNQDYTSEDVTITGEENDLYNDIEGGVVLI